MVGGLLLWHFRNYGLAILLGLYCTLLASDTYYWPNNEVHQGLAWLLLALAINSAVGARTKSVWVITSVFIVSLFLAIWTHPLVMLAAVYPMGFLPVVR